MYYTRSSLWPKRFRHAKNAYIVNILLNSNLKYVRHATATTSLHYYYFETRVINIIKMDAMYARLVRKWFRDRAPQIIQRQAPRESWFNQIFRGAVIMTFSYKISMFVIFVNATNIFTHVAAILYPSHCFAIKLE